SDPIKLERFDPVTRVFSRTDLPELTVRISPSTLEKVPTETEAVRERESQTTGGVTFKLNDPFNTVTGDWPEDAEGRIY
ncbi:MAG: hypothetical protein ABEK50_07945, partial [bacterium]